MAAILDVDQPSMFSDWIDDHELRQIIYDVSLAIFVLFLATIPMFCFKEKVRRKRKFNIETQQILVSESDSLASDEVYASVEDSDELSFDSYTFDEEFTFEETRDFLN